MIKTIIKRDGTHEEFSPSKVNGWGEWAAKTLGTTVDWSSIVVKAVSHCPEVCESFHLQESLIKVCLEEKTWEYNRMAGRLYAQLIDRMLYSNERPTVKQLHEILLKDELMVKLNYSAEDYAEVEKIINHKQDLKYPHYQLHQIRYKYSLRNKVTGREYESPQFVYMRMAMALAEDETVDRLYHVQKFYEHFSQNRLNPPTPNFVNLGTKLRGYASCCLYTVEDNAASLAAGDHIAYMMTCMSAGIGAHLKTRSLGDAVRGGLIQHQGKLPYYRAVVAMTGANLQNGRGGAATIYYTAFDPEVEVIQKLRHPMTPANKKIAGCHYSFGSNKFFARRVARNEDITLFSYAEAPELYEAQYDKDQVKFEQLYIELEQCGGGAGTINARDLLLGALTQSYETGVQYTHQFDTINHHTPFKEPIYSSNLCSEIAEHTKAFKRVDDLYRPYQEGDGEIALCNLAGIIVSNIENDEQYADVSYYALKMIDKTIHLTDYVFRNLEDTAKSRMNAGVGILGLAHLMAKKHLTYSSQAGRDFIHELAETHAWHLINASLRLGRELGNAPWMHKTKWPDGWLPIDTYERRADELITVQNKRDWNWLRGEIIANGGIRNTVLIAHMPGESSTLASGTTNGLYPIREFSLIKTNETMINHWVAPDSTKLKYKYELAWDISTTDMIKVYAIMQKWCDQAISADLFIKVQGDQKISSSSIVQDYLDQVRYGMKTRYYVNSLTSEGIKFNSDDSVHSSEVIEYPEERGCAGGVCTL